LSLSLLNFDKSGACDLAWQKIMLNTTNNTIENKFLML
jgi:hypothetical protein